MWTVGWLSNIVLKLFWNLSWHGSWSSHFTIRCIKKGASFYVKRNFLELKIGVRTWANSAASHWLSVSITRWTAELHYISCAYYIHRRGSLYIYHLSISFYIIYLIFRAVCRNLDHITFNSIYAFILVVHTISIQFRQTQCSYSFHILITT